MFSLATSNPGSSKRRNNMKTSHKPSDDSHKTFDPIMLRPVGVVRNEVDEPFLKAKEEGIEIKERMAAIKARVRKIREMKSEIVIRREMAEILHGVEEYSHLMVLYWAHKLPEQSRSLTRVHPMGRKDIPLTGIYSTCSPARPNPVLACVVRLCGIRDNVLEVAGIDAINGSPVIDIKPYVREWYPQKGIRIPEWMRRLQEEVSEDDPESIRGT
jgi:tRNA-Thr(GGU) m(6)t(6)A37 methyltransferase TsaA